MMPWTPQSCISKWVPNPLIYPFSGADIGYILNTTKSLLYNTLCFSIRVRLQQPRSELDVTLFCFQIHVNFIHNPVTVIFGFLGNDMLVMWFTNRCLRMARRGSMAAILFMPIYRFRHTGTNRSTFFIKHDNVTRSKYPETMMNICFWNRYHDSMCVNIANRAHVFIATGIRH